MQSRLVHFFDMKGITFYYEDIKRSMERMTMEEVGIVFTTIMKSLESETIPTFEDERLDILADGFKNDMEKGLNKTKAKRENGLKGGAPVGNQNAKRINPNPKCVGTINLDSAPVIKQIEKEEVNENNLQLFLGYLQDKKPQKNQALSLLLMANPSISGYCETNKINKATQEKAWDIYVNSDSKLQS